MLDAVDNSSSRAAFPIVGVGASAGGLEAFTQLLSHLPKDPGLAFVLIQHLDRTQPSLLSEALHSATEMPVRQAEQGMQVEPSHVYVIAPNTDIAIHRDQLMLSARPSDGPRPHLPVDFFLRSLAAELGNRAIGVILSGSGSDGTEGLRAIRNADGITFAQQARSAKFASMPQSAIDAGVVDYCMDLPELAEELVRLSRDPYMRRQQLEPRASHADNADDNVLEAIFARVRAAIGIDFSEFKPSTVTRRLARRMAVRRVVDLRAYLTLLEAEPDEIRELYEAMLIHVTSFFRDPAVFDSLRASVFPELLKHKLEGSTLRVWAAGCSTGEEVYSLAIELLEFLAESAAAYPMQLFGSDVSEVAVQKARAGVYTEHAMRGVSDDRRKRYFGKVEGGYRINKSVRDLCVFVHHDLVRDPPFSKLDLVSCRNVLIYFDQALQKRVLPTLHYCLNLPGFLLLGHSENILGLSQLFSIVDKTNKIFARTAALSSLRFAPRADAAVPTQRPPDRERGQFPEHSAIFAKHVDRLLLARYCPPGVLVRENLDILLFRGQTGAYLQPAPGQPQNNLVGMARGGLIAALRATIKQAKQDMVVVRSPNIEVDQGISTTLCDVVVIPFAGIPNNQEALFVVLFEAARDGPAHTAELELRAQVEPDASTEPRRNARLEQELAATKEYLQTLIEEHGHASDELGTSNEELVSGNEELQSMNEELETAKEELQSINEELSTLNDELRSRNQEVTQVNGDLLNFALTVDIAIVTLDMERRVRRITPKAHTLLNIVPSDLGRSIDNIKLGIDVPDLNQRIAGVIRSSVVNESEVRDKTGRWYRMQIRPYMTAADGIEGVILSFVDIHELKQLVAEAQSARAEAERASVVKDDFLATLSHELRTPLSSMLLNAQRLRGGDVMDSAGLKRAGDALERATWTQMKLIDDLLDVSRIVAGKLTLDCRAVDLGAVVQTVLDTLSPLIEAKALVLDLSLAPELDPIWADRARVHQVVTNLVRNAIKFTPSGGRVTVVVDASADFVRVRVTDTGIGIASEFLPEVFARFSQSDSSITREYGGLGLGLAVVRHLVELQGGTVQAESEGPGKGASFSITFPVARLSTASEPHAASGRTQALDRPGRSRHYAELVGLRVLFVDDDLRTREAILEVLQLTGAQVRLAESAAEGIAAIDTFMPQVILCDIAMPGEDGYTFMRKVRAREAGRAPIPALALTALASEEDRRRAFAAGFQLHLAKPIDIDRLREAVLELSKLA